MGNPASDTEGGYAPSWGYEGDTPLEEAEQRLAAEAQEVRQEAQIAAVKAEFEARLAELAKIRVTEQPDILAKKLGVSESVIRGKTRREIATLKAEVIEEAELELLEEQQRIARRGQQTVETEIETKCREWLTIHGEPFNFETELLGGRVDLQFIPASFIIERTAVRFFEQNTSQRQMQKAILSSMGYKVIDKAPTKMLDIDYEMEKILEDIYPLKR